MSGLPRKRPTAVDLFAGAGGLSLGFEQAGFDIVAANEIDPIHAAIHELNFPHTATICRDIRELTGDDIRASSSLGDGELDTLIGGPPCQGFSLIGHRVLDDPRNELVFHFLRLVDELRPRTFVMENVPGMATGRHTQLLEELIARFGAIGYKVRLPYQILNAAEYGVPQVRRRLFLLGAREGTPLPEYPRPTTQPAIPSGATKNGKVRPELSELPTCPTVDDAIGDLPDIEEFDRLFETDELWVRLEAGSPYARRLRGDECDESDFSYPRDADRDLLTGCLRARHTDLSRERFAGTRPGDTEPVSRFFRLPPDGTANTLRAGTASDRGAFTSPRPIHPRYARCISVREAARLHSYPDWFRFHKTIWHGFRQIGNSVPPLLARSVAEEVRTALGIVPCKPETALIVTAVDLASFNMSRAASYFEVNRDVIPTRQRSARIGS